MQKPVATQPLSFSIDTLLSLIKNGIEKMDLFAPGANASKVKNVLLANGGDTVVVGFYAKHRRSLDIKTEIANITGFLSATLKGDLYKSINIKYLGVRAYDEDDLELMYAVCSRNTAEITKGNLLEWIRLAWFQENTPDYRQARAKTIISDIENALRKAISKGYQNRYGATWWDAAIDPKIGKSIKNTYNNQFGSVISDGEILIDYAYTLDLKKIVSADWGTFRRLFSRKATFEDLMVKLNEIRREEAHNREISELHLTDLEYIHDELLVKIAELYPEVTVNYMVENWRLKIKEALIMPPTCIYTMEEFNKQDLFEKLRLISEDTQVQITYWTNVISKFKSLKPPPAKRIKHQTLTTLLDELLVINKLKLKRIQDLELDDVHEISSRLHQQLKKMDDFSKEFLLSES